jgi:hypothetical protein
MIPALSGRSIGPTRLHATKAKRPDYRRISLQTRDACQCSPNPSKWWAVHWHYSWCIQQRLCCIPMPLKPYEPGRKPGTVT